MTFEIKQTTAQSLEKAEEIARELTQNDLDKIDSNMHVLEAYDAYSALEWGYYFHLLCLKDAGGKKGYQKLGYDSEAEYLRTFPCITRRTAYSKRRFYEIWVTYYKLIDVTKYCKVGYTKVLAIQHEIEKHGNNPKKLNELLREADTLFRHELIQKYRNHPPKIYFEATLSEATDTGGIVLDNFELKTNRSLTPLQGERVKGYLQLVVADKKDGDNNNE